jgi:cytochrome c553
MRSKGVFNINNITATGVALVVLLTATAAFAQSDVPAQPTPTPKKQLKKKPKKQVSAPIKAVEPAPAVSVPVPPKVSLEPATDDSAEAVKQRIGTGNPLAGKLKSELCQGCHGEEGNSPSSMIPNLAGQYAKYIAKQLRNFQAGIRTHQIMSAIAATISDDDLTDITAYFASRTKMKGDGSAGNPAGKNLFLNGDMSRMIVGCVNCHGENGRGKTPRNPVFPVIGGQQSEYVRGQLANFRGGDRTNSPGGVMNIIAQRMTDAELDALADYVSRL